MFVVFDLDGTLALNGHRQHFLDQSPKDWASWHAACLADTLCIPVLRALEAHVQAGHRVEIWTGRSGVAFLDTILWLESNGIGVGLLKRMRPDKDHQPDVSLKRAWLREERERGGGPDLVYDDRDSVVAMWREEGVTCFQVAPGPF